MKRFRGSSFFAGAVSTFLVLSIGVTFANASELFSGKTLYNQTGIAVFGTETIKKGEAFRAPNGQDVPSVITYVDETGGKPIISPSARSLSCWMRKFHGMPRPAMLTLRLPEMVP